ncbi:FAD-binding oxidoreductase [Streptomyces sp. Z26]|uniref:FAD-binding oxidoreductase n=1 Tax=Streptomyces sp. Z26 TaxID=2500177 RepID=UPI000EF15CAC|nr:FAD-binding oxidoreductase [Streptomyces sp. Z26]RLL67584.1 FAD-binding oxidoreductase [Streptomyces sp. Z26]
MNSTHALSQRVRGPVLAPGDAGYDAETAGFQSGLEQRPDLVVGARDADDVRAAVRYAADHGMPVRVQATGHGTPAAARGGMLLGTRRMDAVRVDPVARTVRVRAGARWEQVIAAAAPYGLAPPNGSAPHSGVVGYTLGGGLGLLARRFGYAADQVRAVDLVTADGRLRHLTATDLADTADAVPTEDPDGELFRALCGGRSGFGVVTGLEIGLVPVPRLYGGSLAFDGQSLPEVLEAYRDWTEDLPEEATSSLVAMVYPDVPQVPEALRGRHVVQVRLAYTGAAADGERLVAPLRAVGPRLADGLRDMPYAESPTIHRDPTDPHPYTGSNTLLSALDPAAVAEFARRGGPGAEFFSVVQLHHLGGALSRPPRGGNAVGHRDARYSLSVLSVADAEREAEAREFQRRSEEPLAPWAVGRFLNFLFGVTTADDVRAAYEPGTWRRLEGLRQAYDPEGLFRTEAATGSARA